MGSQCCTSVVREHGSEVDGARFGRPRFYARDAQRCLVFSSEGHHNSRLDQRFQLFGFDISTPKLTQTPLCILVLGDKANAYDPA